DPQHQGISTLLCGHKDDVNVVKFFHPADEWPCLILSGSVDQSIRLWQTSLTQDNIHRTISILEGHTGSINCINVASRRQILASGAADATIKLWRVGYENHQWEMTLLQTIQTRPRFIPLTLTLSVLDSDNLLLAAAGTRGDIYVYATRSGHNLTHQVTLSGHEGWIRSLAFASELDEANSDFLLASASQDKYIRLWRIRRNADSEQGGAQKPDGSIDFESLLSNKAYRVETSSKSYSIAFEALLLGHDDWIYKVSWRRIAGKLRLLSASADNSLAMWDSDAPSGVWLCTTRIGEISAQKGSTTATGSMGGFWIGLWLADGQSVVGLGRTGSWRLWNYDSDRQRWVQGVGISGHTKSVMDIAWATDGSYLLSTGSDQTTRLHAEWINGTKRSWHEFARPQIHGYDLNCIDTVGAFQFVSGADEKLLRVFDEPKSTAELLRRLCGVGTALEKKLPEAANIPVLGLSNKAVRVTPENQQNGTAAPERDVLSQSTDSADMAVQDSSDPPIEDDLARHTLWPEREKLYGHGYEISAVAASHDGSLIATACKASSLDHAVIRVFETQNWRELKPPLRTHSLTVTSLRFSGDGRSLLSTGRDRQWAVFAIYGTKSPTFRLIDNNLKAHSRMILSGCWAPTTAGGIIVTGGRDKTSKLWLVLDASKEPKQTLTASAPITAVDMLSHLVRDMLVLAVATEGGDVSIYFLDVATLAVKSFYSLEDTLRPLNSITQLLWRPLPAGEDESRDGHESIGQVALSSDDCSLRIFSISLDRLKYENGT
ncbi:MAG: hypothetical protein Q9181_005319, partial [Wetmoreana brouardii]